MANPVKISDSLTLDSSVTAASSKAIKNLHEAISNERIGGFGSTSVEKVV